MRIVVSEFISLTASSRRPAGRKKTPTAASPTAGAMERPIAEGLVDELRLMIEPITLGGGKTIFADDGAKRTFELISAVTAATGVQLCTYRPA